jgi:hypothetical protein
MRTGWSIRRLLSSVVLVAGIAAAADAPKPPVPAADEQAEARAEVRRRFQVGAGDAQTLVRKLLDAAEQNRGKAALRHALLSDAKDVAARAGAPGLAMDAAQRLADGFAVPDPLGLKADALLACAKGLLRPAAHEEATRLAMPLAWAAIRAERHEIADRLLQLAEKSAKMGVSLGLPRRVARDREVLAAAKREAPTYQLALRTLKASPNDPTANLIVGRYLCFAKSDWAAGLAHLARGKDPLLKKLAEEDLKAAQLHENALLTLADAWHDAADALPPGQALAQIAMRQRAAHHYRALLTLWGNTAGRRVEHRRVALRLAAAPRVEDGGAGAAERKREVDAAVKKAVAVLYQQHNARGHWEPDPANDALKAQGLAFRQQEGGVSALAAHALLTAGEDPAQGTKLQAALNYLAGAQINGTYSLSYRVQSLGPMAAPNSPAQRVIAQDVAALAGGARADGLFSYHCPADIDKQRGDLSSTQHAWIALAEGARRGAGVPPRAWAAIADTLVRNQDRDGGWAYHFADPTEQTRFTNKPSPSMTAAACTILLLAQEHVARQHHAALRTAVERGMAFLDESFQSTGGTSFVANIGSVETGFRYCVYFLVTVQRLGHLSGRTAFNQTDWYDAGCGWLLGKQNGDGSFGTGTPADTALALLFLARGRAE